MKLFVYILIFLFHVHAAYADEWKMYTNSNAILDILVDGPYRWCATWGGLVRWDVRDGSWMRQTVADGMSQNCLNEIAGDGAGRLWVSVANGAMCYDGTAWANYDGNDVLSWIGKVRPPMLVDRKGKTWAGDSEGLVCFDGDTHTVFTPGDGLAEKHVTAIAIDRNDVLWIGTNAGISRYDGKTWITYDEKNGLPGHKIKSLAVDTENTVWVVTDTGAFFFSGTEWNPMGEQFASGQVAVGPDNVKWFATSSKGLHRYDGENWTVYTKENSGLPDNVVVDIAVDESGVLWLSCGPLVSGFTGHGLTRFDGESWTSWKTDGPLYNIGTGAAVDHDNAKWFATFSGISRFDGKTWSSYPEMKGGISPIIVDKGNRVWFRGKFSFDGPAWTVHTPDNTPPQLLDMISYAADRNGVEWVGTNSLGLWRFDGAAWKNYTSADGLPDGAIRTLTFDRENTVWISSYNGLAAFDGRSFTTFPDGPDSLITSIAVDSRNRKWVGTMISGVWSFDGVRWENHLPPADIFMLDNWVQNIAVDGDDVKWIFGMYGKLFRLSDTGWETYENGPGASQFKAIAIGPDNVKWFMTYESGVISLETDSPTPLLEKEPVPADFNLHGSFPNPFNASTVIRFSLQRDTFTELSIYNNAGQRIRTLVSELRGAGDHAVRWDGKDDRGIMAASGFYFARIHDHTQTQSMKLLLLK